MGVIDYFRTLRYVVQDGPKSKGDDYVIYSYRKDHNDMWTYFEAWTCSENGMVFGYEIWSDTFGEFVSMNLLDQNCEHRMERIDAVREFLLVAIEEYQSLKERAM